MMLFADVGMTIADLIHANWGWFAAAFATVGAWVARVWWVKVDKRWDAHDARMELKSTNENKTLATLTETLPVLAANGERQTEILEECRSRDSDFVRLMANISDGLDNVAVAVVAGSCPDRTEVASAHLKEHLDRVEKRKKESKKE